MLSEFLRMKCIFYVVVTHSLQISSVLLYPKMLLLMVTANVSFFNYNSFKYEANFLILSLLISQMISAYIC